MKYQLLLIDQISVAAWMLGALLFAITLGAHAQQTVPPMADYFDGELLSQDPDHAASSTLETIVVLREGEHTLLEVLSSIADQAGLKLSYSEQIIPVDKKVRITQTRLTTKQALWHVLQGTSYRFGVSSTGQLVLLRTPPPPAQVQPETITGTVSDARSGETLPGVNILVKGTSTGASTESDGTFELAVESLQDTLVVSFVGYQTLEVPINGRTELDVNLQPQTITGEEMVVVGYGTQKKENLTGSVTQISGDKLDSRVLSDPIEGLQGQVSGLNVSVSNAGGRPGAPRNFNIRGVGSLSGGSPYVLVDGVPQDLSTVDPQAVENISVLKGPAASAIYGARAPYGVVLVTTKSGSNKGGLDISYNTHVGLNAPTVVPNKANSLQWAQTLNQAATNGGQSRLYSEETIQRMRTYMQDPGSIPGTVPSPSNPNRWAAHNGPDQGYTANANTDLYDAFLKPWAMNQTHNLSVSGGGESVTYYVAGGLFKQNGQMRYANDDFKKYNLTANTRADVTEWLDLNINTKFTNRYSFRPIEYGGGSGGRYFFSMARRPPNEPIYDPNGHILSRLINTAANGGKRRINRNTFVGSVQAIIDPLPGWNIHADFNTNLNYRSQYFHKKEVQEYAVDESTYPVDNTYPTSYREIKNEWLYQSSNVYTSYQLNPGRHFVKGLVGFQTERSHSSRLSASRTELITDFVPSISTATGTKNVGDAKGHWATDGAFFRLQYNYDQKYLIEFNGRYDGSSRFQEDKRWGFFPSVSAGYNIAREPFWKGLRDKINLLKIRGSYGSLGNHDVANYLYLNTLGTGRARWVMGNKRPIRVGAPGLISNDLTWETANTVNLGLDVEMLENRLSLTFDWYQRRTLDMFGPAKSYPAVLGTSAPRRNNADLRTRGYELSLGWRDQIGQVQYNVKALLSDHRSVVTRYNNQRGLISDYYAGQELGEIWGYTTEGLYSSDEAAQNDPNDRSFLYPQWNAGDIHYKDLNGDGKINNGNRTLSSPGDLSIIGNSTPRYNYSLNLGLQWKGIDFSMLWQGLAKRDLWLNGTMFWGPSGTNQPHRNASILKEHLDYWKPDNKDAYYPKVYLSGENSKNIQSQTRYLQNGAYLRLKNVHIGYKLPQEWVSKINVNQLQIYLEGENLLTFSPIMEAFDPEATATGPTGANPGQIYPIAKTLAVGLQLSL